MTQDTATIDELLATLDAAVKRKSARGDAIDAVLASPGRVTHVTSIKDSPQAKAFRQAVVDGMIRTDTNSGPSLQGDAFSFQAFGKCWG